MGAEIGSYLSYQSTLKRQACVEGTEGRIEGGVSFLDPHSLAIVGLAGPDGRTGRASPSTQEGAGQMCFRPSFLTVHHHTHHLLLSDESAPNLLHYQHHLDWVSCNGGKQ